MGCQQRWVIQLFVCIKLGVCAHACSVTESTVAWSLEKELWAGTLPGGSCTRAVGAPTRQAPDQVIDISCYEEGEMLGWGAGGEQLWKRLKSRSQPTSHHFLQSAPTSAACSSLASFCSPKPLQESSACSPAPPPLTFSPAQETQVPESSVSGLLSPPLGYCSISVIRHHDQSNL